MLALLTFKKVCHLSLRRGEAGTVEQNKAGLHRLWVTASFTNTQQGVAFKLNSAASQFQLAGRHVQRHVQFGRVPCADVVAGQAVCLSGWHALTVILMKAHCKQLLHSTRLEQHPARSTKQHSTGLFHTTNISQAQLATIKQSTIHMPGVWPWSTP